MAVAKAPSSKAAEALALKARKSAAMCA